MESAAPSVKRAAFKCPHCKAYARQVWFTALANAIPKNGLPTILNSKDVDPSLAKALNTITPVWAEPGTMFLSPQPTLANALLPNSYFSRCDHCGKVALWFGERLAFPVSSTAPPPHKDMPLAVKADYLEAAAIGAASPRGSAALLRLAIQKLCIETLGQQDINAAAAALVARGLDQDLIKALDVLRVVGNNAVHPGEMILDDDRQTVSKLFELANLCVDGLISRPQRIAALFDSLPDGARGAIEARNSRNKPSQR